MRLAILISAALLILACGDSAPAEPEQPSQPQQAQQAQRSESAAEPQAEQSAAQAAEQSAAQSAEQSAEQSAGQSEGEQQQADDSSALEGEVWFAGGAVELPERAIATVSLLDTSLQDVAATLISEQVLAVSALPFDFRIEYDPALIEDRNEYSLQAQIELDDDLLYVNDTVHIVLTGAGPAQSDIEVIRVAPPKAGEALTSVTVRVVTPEGAVIPLGSEITARMVNAHRRSELIDEISIPILAFPINLNLLYDMFGLDSTYTYAIEVFIAEDDRLTLGLLSPIRFDPSSPPDEPLLAELEPVGSD